MAKDITSERDNKARQILQDEAFASMRDSVLNLSQLELCALQILSLPESQALTDNEKNILSKLLEKAKGDSSFNQRLKQAMTQNLSAKEINEQAVRSLIQFTDKTRHAAVFASAFAKLNQEPPLLLFNEYAILLDTVKLGDFFKSVQSRIILSDDLAALAEQVVKAPLMLSQIEESLKNKASGSRPKALLFEGPQPERTVGAYPQFFAHCVSKTKPSPAQAVSEAVHHYYAQNYTVNFDNLLSEKNKMLLKSVMGENYLEAISRLYADLVRENHDILFRQCAGMQNPMQMVETFAESEPHLLVSEFLGPTVFNAFIQLEDKLQEILQSKQISAENLIVCPFSEKEAFEKTPLQLLAQMKLQGQVVELKPEQKRYTS